MMCDSPVRFFVGNVLKKHVEFFAQVFIKSIIPPRICYVSERNIRYKIYHVKIFNQEKIHFAAGRF